MPPLLPTEVVALVMDQLWDSLCVHPALDYLVIPERHHVHLVYGSCRLVSSTWLALATPYWNRFEKPSKKEDSKREANVDEVVDAEALAQRRFFDLAAAANHGPEEAGLRWTNALSNRAHLTHLAFLLDHQAPAFMPFFPLGSSVANDQLHIMVSVVGKMPVDRRQRLTSAVIKIATSDDENNMAGITATNLLVLAQHLPVLRDLTLHGDESPIDLSEAALDGRHGEGWWTGLHYLTLLDVISTGDDDNSGDWTYALARILVASSNSLRHVELVLCEFAPNSTDGTCALEGLFGLDAGQTKAPSILYPSITRLSILEVPVHGPRMSCKPHFFLHRFPHLERLALDDLTGIKPNLLLHLPRTLTHLTVELASSSSAWHQPLVTFIHARGTSSNGSLRYLSVDRTSAWVNDDVLPPGMISLEALQEIQKTCSEVGVYFASADERLWRRDGLPDDYAEETGDVDDGASSVGESEVEDGDDWDAEPEEWGNVLGAQWSEGKKREVALETAVEQLRGALKPGVGLGELKHALGHLLVPVPKREKDSATAVE